MLAVWRDWNLNLILKKAYEKGIVMSGVSAGAICWFEKGITDSYAKNLEILNCLGFVIGIACPHFDEEKEREPYVNDLINREVINSCICIEGYSALHINNQNAMRTINFGDDKKCFKLFKKDNKIIKKIFL